MSEDTYRTVEQEAKQTKRDSIRIRDTLLALQKTEGWKLYIGLVEEGRDLRDKQLREPMPSLLDLPLREYMRGVSWAFDNVIGLLDITVAYHQSLIDSAMADEVALQQLQKEREENEPDLFE